MAQGNETVYKAPDVFNLFLRYFFNYKYAKNRFGWVKLVRQCRRFFFCNRYHIKIIKHYGSNFVYMKYNIKEKNYIFSFK